MSAIRASVINMTPDHNNDHSLVVFRMRNFRACLAVAMFVASFGFALFAAISTAQANVLQIASNTSSFVLGEIAWTQVVSGMTNLNCRTMAMNPITPSLLFAATERGDFRSMDGGSNWELIRSNDPYYTWGNQFVVDESNPSVVYLLESGILRSEDNGDNWQTISGDLAYANDAVTFAPSPISPTVLFVGLRGDISGNWGAYRTINGGLHWEKINSLPNTAINHIVFEPGNPDRMYAATWSGLYVSTNAGETWDAIAGLSQASYSMAVSPLSTTILYVGAQDGVYKSVNRGDTWSKISPASGSFVAIDPIEPGTLYVSYFNSVIRTNDYGATWQTVFSAQSSPFGVVVDRRDQKHGWLYFCNMGSGVYKGTMLLYKAHLPVALR